MCVTQLSQTMSTVTLRIDFLENLTKKSFE